MFSISALNTDLNHRSNEFKSLFTKSVCMLLCLFTISTLLANDDSGSHKSWSDLIPVGWQEDIVMPSLQTSIVIISKGAAASGIPGNADITVRYLVKNNGMETIDDIQVGFDLLGQLGQPPFVALTGSLSALTGSGSVFGMPIGSGASVFGGILNDNYNGGSDDSIFSVRPSLEPDQCISIDVPFEVGDTFNLNGYTISANALGFTDTDSLISFTTAPLSIIGGCESESLACAGEVNVSLGPDCKASISLQTVFLNQVIDPNRYEVVVFVDNVLVDTLDSSHLGRNITYSVLDRCFNNRASCWGNLNLENKNTPTRSSTFSQIYCGEARPNLPSLAQMIINFNSACSVELSNYQETFVATGDRCGDGLIRRVITAEYSIEELKTRDTIHVDSIVELALDLGEIRAPIGGPDAIDAIHVDCADLGGGSPTPSFISSFIDGQEATMGQGPSYAYPHIARGTTDMEMFAMRDTIVETRRDTTVMIDSVLVNVVLVEKDTITVVDTTIITKPVFATIQEGTTCNVTASFSDSFFPGCAGLESKILRTWRVLNWCTGDFDNLDQWIIIDDTTGPNVTLSDTVSVDIVLDDCTASYALTAEVSDACSEIRNLNWASSAGVIDEDNVLTGIMASDSPVRVTLQAVDGCGNDSVAVMIINVIDNLAPVALAKDQLNTTITYDPVGDRGVALVTAESIDAGSHDSNCGPVVLCALLEEELNNPILDASGVHVTDSITGKPIYQAVQCDVDGVYNGIPYVFCREAVKFCCDLVGEQRVALIVNDFSQSSAPGISWTTVTVEDKSFPIVNCQPATVDCGDNVDPELIGFPIVSEGFCNTGTLTFEDDSFVSDCGSGFINRTWSIDGDSTCVQVITVRGDDSFDPKSIKWPQHYDDRTISGILRTCVADTIREEIGDIAMGDAFVCGNEAIDAPIWCEAACSNLFMSFEDLDVEAGEACKKVIRRWTIIDWCTYVPNTEEDFDNDTFEAVSDVDLDVPDARGDLVDGDICASCDKPSNGSTADIFFRYTDVDADGFYTFDQVINVIDNTPPVVDAPEEVVVEISDGASFKDDDFDDCVGTVVVSALAIDLCGDVLLSTSDAVWDITVRDDDGEVIRQVDAFGDSVSITLTGVANTEQIITWEIVDGCNNSASAETTVLFTDILAPVPVCITDLSTSSINTSDGTVAIWASDYDIGSFDNCSEVKTFFRDEDGIVSPSLTFSCEDIPNGVSTILQLELIVADDAGNESICNVSIRIDDNNDVCTDSIVGMATITGQVSTAFGDFIEGARISLNGRDVTTTDESGLYAFENVPMASSYKIEGTLTDRPLNGVSTLDLVLIQRHILALEQFDMASKTIAGDVNSDGRVSALDLVELRRLILGQLDNFQNNDSWIFVDPAQDFDSPTSPWPFIEEIVILDLLGDAANQDLLGIKIGDVNGNAETNSLFAGNRNYNETQLLLTEQQLKKGQRVTIPVSLAELHGLVALQFTLELNGAQINGIERLGLDVNSNNIAIHSDREMTLAWFDQEGVVVGGALFALDITATKDGSLSEMLSITDNITTSEVYDMDLEPSTLSLTYDKSEIALRSTFGLMQNEPNPFAVNTTIGFNLPEGTDATLSVIDISGRVIYSQQDYYTAGYHQVVLSQEQLQSRGVLYYQLKTSTQTATKKMILID